MKTIRHRHHSNGSRLWQVAGRWNVIWHPRGRQRMFSERYGYAPSPYRDVRVGRTAEVSFVRVRRGDLP